MDVVSQEALMVALLATATLSTPAQRSTPTLADIKIAAGAADPVAQDKLGDALRFDTPQAEIWYRKAADQGIVNSQCQLRCV